MPADQHVLTLSCRNRPGIVAAVSRCLFDRGGNILGANQFDDVETDKFFMRVVFNFPGEGSLDGFSQEFSEIADGLGMTWSARRRRDRQRVLLLVSRFDHCLVDLLYRWRIGELPMDIAGIVSNYPRETYPDLDFGEIPFHHFPITKETKPEQEARIWARGGTHRSRRSRSLHAGSIGRTQRSLEPSVHQHPSLIPAGFQGSEAVSSGSYARRETDRSHRSLCYSRPR